MTIQWLGHACFRIACGAYSIVIDPYGDGTVPGLPPLRVRANAVLCSHTHGDHGYTQAVTIVGAKAPSPFQVTRVESTHDDAGGAKRGMNTIHVLQAGGVRVAHLGDLGTMLTPEQMEAIGPLDAVMVPIGGYYTIDAKGAKAVVDALAAPVILPMHYRGEDFGFDEINTLEPFLAQYADIDYVGGDTIEITKGMRPAVAVLAYRGQRAGDA